MSKNFIYIACCIFILISGCAQPEKKGIVTKNDSISYVPIKIEKRSRKFYVISDWGWNGFYYQQAVADAMASFADSLSPNFIVSCGDNFQISGIASVQDPLWLTNFENIYRHPHLMVDWYPVLGNHDYKGNTQAEIDYSKISRRWKLTAHYYSQVKRINDSVSMRLIFLDTPPLVDEYHKNVAGYPDIATQDSAKQMKWLKDELANSKEQWKFVFGHHPVFSASHTHGNTKEMIAKVKPILEKYHVQFYICGHDHDFQHLRVKSGNVDYIVTGTGGEPRPASFRNDTSVFSYSVPGFSLVSVTSDSAKIFFVDSKGKAIYSYARGIN
jgi:tartrate-resistant acid phosphatase type 5